MSYLGKWELNDYLVIPVTTHKFSTGSACAPTSLTYSIYEDNSTVHIDDNIDMVVGSPFDGIVGCYIARRQLTSASGFENGKCYTIVIKAVVDSISTVTLHTFQIDTNELITAQEVWEYSRRTLTYSPDNSMSISDTDLSFIRGDTINYTFVDIDLTDFYKAYFTVKKNYKDDDCDAIIQVSSGCGLYILNSNKVTTGSSRATLTAGSASNITLTINASVTKQFPYSDYNYYYDLQIITTGSAISTPELGVFTIVRDVTNKIN